METKPDTSIPSGSCLARIRAFQPRQGGATDRIASEILTAPHRILPMSVVQVAELCKTTPPTVTRFCKSLGYLGFKEFQIDLATALANTKSQVIEEFNKTDTPGLIIRRVFERNRQSLEDTLSLLDEKTMNLVAKKLISANRIFFLGIGGSGLVAREAAQRFLSLGLTSMAIFDPYEQIFATSNMKQDDVVFGISHTGRTLSVMEGIRESRKRKATTVAITNYPDSPMGMECDYLLLTSFHEHRINAAVSSSRIAQLCILDALYFMVGSLTSDEARRLASAAEERVQHLLRKPGPRSV